MVHRGGYRGCGCGGLRSNSSGVVISSRWINWLGRRNRSSLLAVLLFRGQGCLRSPGNAGGRKRYFRIGHEKLFTRPRKCAAANGNDIVRRLYFLLSVDDLTHTFGLVWIREWH